MARSSHINRRGQKLYAFFRGYGPVMKGLYVVRQPQPRYYERRILNIYDADYERAVNDILKLLQT